MDIGTALAAAVVVLFVLAIGVVIGLLYNAFWERAFLHIFGGDSNGPSKIDTERVFNKLRYLRELAERHGYNPPDADNGFDPTSRAAEDDWRYYYRARHAAIKCNRL